MGWKRLERLDAGVHAREEDLQSIFDGWGATDLRMAGTPDWLIELGRPQLPRPEFAAFGYRFRPDVVWRGHRELVVAELKYGVNNEPIALGEVLHHTHVLGLLEARTKVTPVIVAQYNGWIRAAVHEIRHEQLRHVEVDLLDDDGTKIIWLSDPHAPLQPVSLPDDVPLGNSWRRREWWAVAGEPTWISAREPRPPFLTGPLVMVSRVRGAASAFVLWKGTMPALGDPRWAKTVGSYWIGSGIGDPPISPD